MRESCRSRALHDSGFFCFHLKPVSLYDLLLNFFLSHAPQWMRPVGTLDIVVILHLVFNHICTTRLGKKR